MSQVIIMAQGQQQRLPSLDIPKQLLPVGNSTILGRALEWLYERHVPTVIIGSPGEFHFGWVHYDARSRPLPNAGRCILEGFLCTQLLWSPGRTVILLGDVLYSRAALEAIFADEHSLMFAGTPELTGSTGELFAMAFNPEHQFEIVEAIRKAPCLQVQAHTFDQYQAGHLRDLYRALPESHYLVIDDWTNDVDTEEDLRNFPALVEKALAEDGLRVCNSCGRKEWEEFGAICCDCEDW